MVNVLRSSSSGVKRNCNAVDDDQDDERPESKGHLLSISPVDIALHQIRFQASSVNPRGNETGE